MRLSKKINMFVILLFLFFLFPSSADARNAPGGIAQNGLWGLSIDINSSPYTDYEQIALSKNLDIAYTSYGCSWFASARVNQLTGIGCTVLNGEGWIKNAGTYGFLTGYDFPENGKALACYYSTDNGYSSHVCVIEAVDGDKVLVSEGGLLDGSYNGLGSSYHGYCAIRETNRAKIKSKDFACFVYITGTEPVATVDKGQDGIYRINEIVTVDLRADNFDYSILRVYRTPPGGETYLYWEGQLSPANKQKKMQLEEGYYSCCYEIYVGSRSFSSSWVGWSVVDYEALVDRGNGGSYNVNESAVIDLGISNFNYSILRVYRTPTDGETYLYWEGELSPSTKQKTLTLYYEGHYSCCYEIHIGSSIVNSSWVGWDVVGYEVMVDRGNDGLYYINESAVIDLSISNFDYSILRVYRTPTGGETYLYWEGELSPSTKQKTLMLYYEGHYSCCYEIHIGSSIVNSSWVGWDVIEPINYSLDIDGLLDGTNSRGVVGYGTFDIQVGSANNNDVDIYNNDSVPYGTQYTISDIKATGNHKYVGVNKGSTSGTISENTTIVLEFHSLYDVIFNANTTDSIINLPVAQQKEWNVNLTLSNKIPARSGYRFVNWNTKSDGSGTAYISGAIYSGDAALMLYAQWQRVEYEVVFDANGGTGAPSAQTKKKGVDLFLSADIPTRPGFLFAGWQDTMSPAVYQPGDKYTKDFGLSLKAIWLGPDFVLPNSLTIIEEEAFAGASFTFVSAPATVKTISSKAFAECANLKYILILSDEVSISKDAFSGVEGLTICCHEDSDAYWFAQRYHYKTEIVS